MFQDRLEQIAEELRLLAQRNEELKGASTQTSESGSIVILQEQMNVIAGRQEMLLLEKNDLLKMNRR